MKKLNDGTLIPDRVWYYILDWRDHNHLKFCQSLGYTHTVKVNLHDCTKAQITVLFTLIASEDFATITGNANNALLMKITKPPVPVPNSEGFLIIRAKRLDVYRDGGTALYEGIANKKEYYVWRPTGAVYADSKHKVHLSNILIVDVDRAEPYQWSGEHSPYHPTDTGFPSGSTNDDAARRAAHG